MRLLLDTNILIRWLQGRLTVKLRTLLEAEAAQCYASSAVLWEIALKPKLAEAGLTTDIVAGLVEDQFGGAWLPIRHQHILSLSKLPLHHKDPFDRIMLAQALYEDLAIVTTDSVFDQYKPIKIIQ